MTYYIFIALQNIDTSPSYLGQKLSSAITVHASLGNRLDLTDNMFCIVITKSIEAIKNIKFTETDQVRLCLQLVNNIYTANNFDVRNINTVTDIYNYLVSQEVNICPLVAYI